MMSLQAHQVQENLVYALVKQFLPPSNDEATNAISLNNRNILCSNNHIVLIPWQPLLLQRPHAQELLMMMFGINLLRVQLVRITILWFQAFQLTILYCNYLVIVVQTSTACVNSTGNGAVETYTSNTLTAGRDYYIRIYHAGTGVANGNFSVCVYADVPSCAARISPVSGGLLVTGDTIRWNVRNIRNWL
jgi:hypothetical protein